MANRTRIPIRIADFDGYLTTSDDYLQTVVNPGPPPVTKGEQLGITSQNVADWHTKRQYWEGTLYPKYTNPNTRTKSVNQQVQQFKADFKTFAQPLLDIMAADADATADDEQALNFKTGRKEPTRPTTPIADQCFASIKPLGGGRIKLSCRSDHDTQRASLAEGADSVQIAVKVNDPAPPTPDDAAYTVLLSKATGTHDLGVDTIGKKIYAYFRWYRTKYPNLAGPWSDLQTFTVA